MRDCCYGLTLEKREMTPEQEAHLAKRFPEIERQPLSLNLVFVTKSNEDLYFEGKGQNLDEAKSDLISHLDFMLDLLSKTKRQLEESSVDDFISKYNTTD